MDQSVCDPIGLGLSRSDLGDLEARLNSAGMKLNTDGTEYGLHRTHRFICSIVAKIQDDKVSAEIPADATVWYFNLFDDRDCVVSTEHMERVPAADR